MKKLMNTVATMSILMAMWATAGHAIETEIITAYQLTNFSVEIPAEFNLLEGWSSETSMRFDSETIHEWDDGEEYSSSATIDIYEFEGTIENLTEYANNMVWSVKAMDEECDDPIVEGNTALLRSTSEVGDGYLVNWRFLVVNTDGKIAGGTISYRSEEAQFYDGIVNPIILSIKFK